MTNRSSKIYLLTPLSNCLVMLMIYGCTTIPNEPQYLQNQNLETIKSGYLGNPFENGKFFGQYTSVGAESLYNFIKWTLAINPKRDIKDSETYSLPVVKHTNLPNNEKPYLIWFGHSTVLINTKDKNILTDPVLTSPNYLHSDRLAEVPIDINKIKVDYILASHGHRDHLDEETIRSLQNNPINAYLPLRMGQLIDEWNPNITIQTAGWYQRYKTGDAIDISLLPAYHWHRRSMFDLNSILWGSYIIKFNELTIYFAGDSGYSTHFKEIGQLFGGIDYAILPIGSYDPQFMMKNNHMTPEEAVQAFRDLNAKVLIPIHYGTFDLTDEPVGEPVQRLKQLIDAGTIGKDEVRILNIGEIMYL